MIYFLAFFLPPLGLLLNGQPFAAIFSALLWVICFFVGFFFWPAWLISSKRSRSTGRRRGGGRKHLAVIPAKRFIFFSFPLMAREAREP